MLPVDLFFFILCVNLWNAVISRHNVQFTLIAGVEEYFLEYIHLFQLFYLRYKDLLQN